MNKTITPHPVGRPRIGVTQRIITFRNDDLKFLLSIDPSPTKAIRKLIESARVVRTAPARKAKRTNANERGGA